MPLKHAHFNACQDMRDMPLTQTIILLLSQRNRLYPGLFAQAGDLDIPDSHHTWLSVRRRLEVIQGEVEINMWTPAYQRRDAITRIDILFIEYSGLLPPPHTLTTGTAKSCTER